MEPETPNDVLLRTAPAVTQLGSLGQFSNLTRERNWMREGCHANTSVASLDADELHDQSENARAADAPPPAAKRPCLDIPAILVP